MTRVQGTHDQAFLDDISLRVAESAAPLAAEPGPEPADPPVALTCPAASQAACRRTLVIDVPVPVAGRAAGHQIVRIDRGGRRIKLGKRSFAIRPGRRATVSLRLNAAGGERLASRPRLVARATTTMRQPDGTRLVRTGRPVLVRAGHR